MSEILPEPDHQGIPPEDDEQALYARLADEISAIDEAVRDQLDDAELERRLEDIKRRMRCQDADIAIYPPD